MHETWFNTGVEEQRRSDRSNISFTNSQLQPKGTTKNPEHVKTYFENFRIGEKNSSHLLNTRKGGWVGKEVKMSCLGSRSPGVRDTPFLGSVWGVQEAGKRLPPGELRLSPRSTYEHASQGHKEFTQVQAAGRQTALLLHVRID